MSDTSDFFPYTCDACGVSCCERLQLVNLALGYEDTLCCFNCLASMMATSVEALQAQVIPYILNRECFAKPWRKIEVRHCPRQLDNTCNCHQRIA